MEDEEEAEEPKAKVKEVKMSTIVMTLFPTAVTEEKLQESKEKAITRIFGPAKTLLKVKNPQRAGDFESILKRKIDEHCQEGHLHFSQGEWEKAITCYTKALNLNPNKGELYEKKAEAFLQLCDFQSAAMHLRKVYRMSPKEEIRERLAFTVFIQGQSLYEQKVYLDALDSFTHACELQPQNTLYRMRRYKKTPEFVPQSLKNDGSTEVPANVVSPSHPTGELYEKKAEAFLQLCDFQSAAMHLRKVYRMSPKEEIRERLAFTVFIQGQSLYEQKVYLDALDSFTHACELQPQNTLYRMRSIACLAAMNRFNDCLQMVNEEVEREKKNADLFVLRARLFEYFGKASCCFCNIQEALALDPDHVEARLLLKKMTKEAERSKDSAVTLAIKGNLKGALLKINRAINYNPLDEKYFLFRGTLLRRLKDFSAAIDDYLRAVELCRPDEASEVRSEAEKQVLLSYNDFAVHCYFKGCYEEAVLLLNKAIKGEKNEFGLYMNRGDCFLKLGQLNFAMADYQQALELRPLDPKLRHRISWLSNETGLQDFREKKYLQAEMHFSTAVDNDPWEVKYYLNRAKTRVFLQEFLGAKEDMISALLLNPNKEEVRILMGNLFPGESAESLLDSKVGDLTKTLLDRKLKSFPGGKALQRPLKSAGSEPPTNAYVQIADQKSETSPAMEKEEVSEEKKLQNKMAECQQKSHQANEELKEASQNKPTLGSKTVWIDPCPRQPPKDCPKEPYCWRKF
ncbi:tetratricopeptide repeat protein 16 [Ahaetulla prasina]|uniref:tetratricopeptide repeat protein 16 n=1 Tax=Ahaetulla prasina TaxID=499056 RepID=UPI0026470AA9|nr:tetratricopeptide repeat protein 16 [Ahaetulla prasina]